MTYTTMVDYMNATVGRGRNWVVARRSPRVVAKYGEDVVCLSAARYATLKALYDAQLPNPKRDAALYARTAMDIARKLIEKLPEGYAPGQRSGPNERQAHAALVVALRLGDEAELFS